MGLKMWGSKSTALVAGSALCFSLLACTSSNQSGISPDAKAASNIVGGSDVQNGAQLSTSVVMVVNVVTQEICTASLVGKNFAITAAHCLDDEDPKNLYVFFAAKPSRQSERRQVLDSKASPYWELNQNEEKNTSDIAVIKFEGSALPEGYAPARFLEDSSVIRKGTTAIVLGYGINNPNTQGGAGALRYTTLQVSDPDYSPTEFMFDQSHGTSACHGDSGGPAYVYMKDSKGQGYYYLFGIANHATDDEDDNQCNKGVIYTDVTLFLTWMQEVMKTL